MNPCCTHDHLCLLYDTVEEQVGAVVPFIRVGLERGEKCLYVVDDSTAAGVVDALRRHGVGVDAALKAGALIVVSKEEAYLKGGTFDPDWMISFLKQTVIDAEAEGYRGFRVTGEMTWALQCDAGVERLLEYETKLNQFFPHHNALALCQYNRRRFRPETLLEVIHTHPRIVEGGLVCDNPHYIPPEIYLREKRHPASELQRVLDSITRAERFRHELEIETEDLRRLHEFSVRLSSLDSRQIMQEALAAVVVVERADAGLLWVYDAAAGQLGIGASIGLSNEYLQRIEGLSPKKAASGLSFQRRERVVVEDIDSDPGYPHLREVAREAGIVAAHSTPLLDDGGGVIAVLTTYSRKRRRPTERECRLADLYARQTASAMEKARAYEHARQELAERRRTEAALRQSEEFNRRIIESSSDCIKVLDLEGRLLSMSDTGRKRLGIADFEAIRGHSYLDFWEREDRVAAHRAVHAAAAGRDGRFEGFCPTVRGEPRWWDVSVTPILGAGGQPEKLLCISRDITERKEAEEAVRQSAQQLALVANTAPVLIARCDSSMRFRFVNRAYSERFGITAEECAGRTIAEVIGAAAFAVIRDNIEATLRGERLDFEVEVPYETIGTRWMHCLYAPEADAEGRIVGWVAALADVTQRKRAEEALRLSELRLAEQKAALETVLNEAPLGLYLVDEGFVIRQANPGAMAPAGETGSLSGRNFGALIHALWPAAVADEIERICRRTLAQGGSFVSPERIERPADDGGTQYHRWQANRIPLPDGGFGLVCYFQDITAESRAREAITVSEERYRKLVSVITDVPWTADANGEFATAQPAWSAYTGQSLEELRGFGWMNALHPDDRIAVETAWARARRSGTLYEASGRLWHAASQEYRWFEARATTTLDRNGNVREWVGSHTDVHDRKQTEAAMQQTQRLESLGVLAGGIAHDFNNLLTGVIGNASLLEEIAPAGELRDVAHSLTMAGERMAQLTSQMLAYSGRGQFVVEPLDLSQQVSQITSLVQASIPKNVELRLDLAGDLPQVEADAGQLQQVIMNLVINAAEAMEGRRGTVTVSTGQERLGPAELRRSIVTGAASPGLFVSFTVMDDGCGMDAETIARIFDPFFTTKFTGRGLGLAAVLGIVRAHKGTIEVDSRPGRGSMFRVLLPAGGAGAAEETSAGEAEGTRAGTVLVIDDEKLVHSVAKAALERRGHRVLHAMGGEEGLAQVRQYGSEIGLVLLDLTMPGLSGEATLRELYRLRPDLKVIASSGFHESEARHRFGERLAAFLQKPYTTAKLAAAVAAAVKG